MAIDWLLLITLVWLQTKHFVADYVLQPAWIIDGKGDLRKPGGYVHAAIHAAATMPILWLSMPYLTWTVAVVTGEFLIHFLIDHLKAVYGRRHPCPMNARSFWMLHGGDQLAHHLTYSTILTVVAWQSYFNV
ncbi:UNVERIFIED_ORG: hypothetical protein GGE64_005844 [Rhizobium etli]|uniref:DUF3307 domain-containing protein n=1 Tax=Rhizobium sophoriradicis TaxID=1535245 RepID=UPI000581F2B6|nr:hypothetical protein IE4803_PD00145 [Rhizobium etli bv. phaseoli str. IE4803]UWU37526.1 DUF3307 domain-containing protein [Rhizobium leguminosarum bv. phaseoli]